MPNLVLHVISGDLWGGAEAQMAAQLAALNELGWETHVLLFNDAETHRFYRERNIIRRTARARATGSC